MSKEQPATHFRSSGSGSYSKAHEEYLRLIYEKGRECNSGRVSTSVIADALDVAPASVTNMIKKLASSDPPLLDYVKHQGASLTAVGERVALEVIRHHRLLELFLYRIMEFPWDEVHQEAMRLQHALSPAFVQRMAALLGNPRFDPHGAPIPDEDLNLPEVANLRLSDIARGGDVRVISVPDDDPGMLRYFEEVGLIPSARCSVHEVSAFDGSVRIRVQTGREITLTRDIAGSIEVATADA